MRKIWWLWLPLAFMAVQMAIEIALPADILVRLHSENGPHELLQFVAIAAAFIVAVRILLRMDIAASRGLAAWIGLAALGSCYVAGEEISWGQHFLDWTTPEFWSALNDQHETNLHNMSSWFDQKPRILLEIGVVVGGLIVPACAKWRPALLPARFTLIYPPAQLAVPAALFFILKLADTVADLMHARLFERVSEVQEMLMYYFILLYLMVLKDRAPLRKGGAPVKEREQG